MLRNNRISHLGKVQNKNFQVITKYHLSISLLAKKTYFHFRKVQNKNFSVISKHGIPSFFFFFLRTESSSVLVLKISCKFRKYQGKIFAPTFFLEKDPLLLPYFLPSFTSFIRKIHNMNFSFHSMFMVL